MIECQSIASSCIYLMPPRNTDTVSEGYQIQIPISLGKSDEASVQKIIDNHHLALEKLNDRIIIYEPINH